MSRALNIESAPQAVRTGYAGRPVTKAPNWHGLVTLDILFNNLSTGLFLVTAFADLLGPAGFGALARVAYPVALGLLVADLVCLVVELGDPLRFHHMLRVWKPSSPMSLGVWCLTAYAVPLTALSVISLLPRRHGLEVFRGVVLLVGVVFALGAAAYKGVLFSTTAQPGWSKARWLGGYLINSALMLGAAELLFLAIVLGRAEVVPVLRLALTLLLILNVLALGLLLSDLREPLSRAHDSRSLATMGALAVALGLLVPLALLALGAPSPLAVLLILLGALVVRHELVRLPHLLMEA
jgi:hypothetical protein